MIEVNAMTGWFRARRAAIGLMAFGIVAFGALPTTSSAKGELPDFTELVEKVGPSVAVMCR